MKSWISVLVLFVLIVGGASLAAQEESSMDGRQPERIYGTYETSYYARFADWEIFPTLLPLISFDNTLRYEERFDLTPQGQIIGREVGDVAGGTYYIELPPDPTETAWFDTDGDPSTPSQVKVFVAGIANGIINTDYVSRYDFLYTRSFRFDPNTQLWDGEVLVWSAADDVEFPILNGQDNRYYTDDDITVTVPQGWSVVEVQAKVGAGRESVRVYHTTQPYLALEEPNYLSDVDLTDLSYEDAFITLLDELERTYIFTDYRGVDWTTLREQYAPQAANVQDAQGFLSLLQEVLFSFRDGHLVLYGDGLPSGLFGRLGLQIYPYDDGLIVINSVAGSPASDAGILPGTVITAVNGLDATAYFETITPTIYSGGHESGSAWLRGEYAFRGEPGTRYELTYRLPDGTTTTAIMTTEILSPSDGDATPPDVLSYDILPSGVGIVRILNFTSAIVDDRWDDAINMMLDKGVDRFIIDLRNNGGGFSLISNYMFGDFIDQDIYSGREISALDEDGDGVIDIQEEYYYGRQQRLDASQVAVLIGPDCFSACEFAAQGFKDLGATVIGHLTSGGAGGGVGASYYLPDNTVVYGMAVVRSEDPNGNIMVEGVGVELDIQVPFDPQDLVTGVDTVLETAETWLLELD